MSSDSKRQREPRARQATPPDDKTASRAGKRARTDGAAARSSRPVRGHRGPLGLDSDQSARMLLFGVTAVVLIAAAAFLIIGYYVSVIQPRGRTVLEVEGIEVSYSAMKRRMAHEYYSNPTYQDPQTVEFVSQIAYGNLLEELTLITKAESVLGLTIDPAAIDAQERAAANVGPQADEASFAAGFREALSNSRLHDNEFRRKIRAAAIEEAARAKLEEGTPETVEQAKVEVITTETADVAQQAIDRVRAGEVWATVATELSTEPNVATTMGVKEYAFKGRHTPAYDEFAFSAPPGEVSDPLQDASGAGPFYVVRVIDRSPQPLTDGQRGPYLYQQYEKWLEDTQTTMVIVDNWTTDEQAQADAARPLIEDAIEKYIARQEEQNRPQPTVDPGAVQTQQAAGTAAAETQVASGTPLLPAVDPTTAAATPAVTTPDATASTPVATAADGQ
jgi:parvulin-like peptidyl-prolyl isomerase